MVTIGENIRLLRRRKGLTQQDLADKLAVNRCAIYRWEKGETYFSLETATRMADILGVSLDTLAGRTWPRKEKP